MELSDMDAEDPTNINTFLRNSTSSSLSSTTWSCESKKSHSIESVDFDISTNDGHDFKVYGANPPLGPETGATLV